MPSIATSLGLWLLNIAAIVFCVVTLCVIVGAFVWVGTFVYLQWASTQQQQAVANDDVIAHSN